MFVSAFFLFLAFNLSSEFQEFKDLPFQGLYTNWSTNGYLSPILFRVLLDEKNPPPAIRVSITSEKVSEQNPLTVIVIHGRTVHNIGLPRIQSNQDKKYKYWFATDTLCDDDRSLEQLGQPVFISVASSLPIDFSLMVKLVDNFHYDKSFSVQTSPSEPRFFMYTFPENVEKVDIRVHSDSDICARLIVRRASCPLFDGSGRSEFSDVYFYQTFTKFAGFFKNGMGAHFHIAFTVMPDDSLCDFVSTNTTVDYLHRDKDAKISITPAIDQTFISVFPLLLYGISIVQPTSSTDYRIETRTTSLMKYRLSDRNENNEPNDSDGNNSETVICVEKAWLFDKPIMIVSHQEYQKQRLVKEAKYFNFLFFQIFGALLPALTTLFQRRRLPSDRGNLDVCHLNYLCSLDMFHLNSLNSVASVSSFALVGILNLIVVFQKKIFCYQVPRIPTSHGIQQRDAPKVVCLLGYVAFGMLGVIINNCPDKSMEHLYNYTCLWMFLSAIMWIYSKRHGVRKWQQLYVIAVSSVFGCLTFAENMFEQTDSSKIALKCWFLVFSVTATLYFCYQYYFERPSGLASNQWISGPLCAPGNMVCDGNGIYQPLRSKRAYVIMATGFSIYNAFTTLTDPEETITHSTCHWAKYQALIYFFYYLIQKIRFEKSTFTGRYKIVSLGLITVFVLSITTLHFFLVKHLNTRSVTMTPAKSRELNRECLLPGIDWNDIRNYIRSLTWFIFLILMDYIDSNIKNLPKKSIFVF